MAGIFSPAMLFLLLLQKIKNPLNQCLNLLTKIPFLGFP